MMTKNPYEVLGVPPVSYTHLSSAVARSAATAAASLSTPILNSVMLSKSRECSSMVGSMEFK